MYTIRIDGVEIYKDMSPDEGLKVTNPRLVLSDNAAGSLEITIPPTNIGYNVPERLKSEITVYRDSTEIWSGRIISEKVDFWNNRILTCEGEMAYLNDTIQPQHKYEAGVTVQTFLKTVLDEHNKRFTDERYKFYVGESRIYNADEALPEIITDYETTLDCINKNIIEAFQCHIRIEKINGKKYIGFVKDEQQFSENTQEIRFGNNLLDFVKNWDLTDLATVLIPRGVRLNEGTDDDSDAFDKYVTLSDIPNDDVKYRDEEWGHYQRNPDGSLSHDSDGNLIYVYDDVLDENDDIVYKYKKDGSGYISLETDGGKVTIRVNTKSGSGDIRLVEFLDYSQNQNGIITAKIKTDGSYAEIAFRDEAGNFPYLKDIYGRVEQVVDFDDAADSVELIKKLYKYLKEQQFDKMRIEVSAVDLQYLSSGAEPLKILDRIRCISRPHGMNTLFTVTELSMELDKPESAKYTLQKTLDYTPKQTASLSGAMGAVSAELESSQSSVLYKARANADRILREKTNGYVTLVTETDGGRHSEALVISSGKDYKKSEHFWIWNVNGLGHYTEYGDESPPIDEFQRPTTIGDKSYTLNVGITMDGQIVANRITVGHMSADRVRTGVLMSEDENVIWNLNNSSAYVSGKQYAPGSLTIRKGSIDLGGGMFTVNDDGELHAEIGDIGGFIIESDNIHNDGMRLDDVGLHMYKDNTTNIGFLGISYWQDSKSNKSLAMNLEHDGSAIWWGYRARTTDSYFTVKLLYAAKSFANYSADTLNVHCKLDMHNFSIVNTVLNNVTLNGVTLNSVTLGSGCTINPYTATVSGGFNGDILQLSSGAIKSDGTIDNTHVKTVTVKNGFIMG